PGGVCSEAFPRERRILLQQVAQHVEISGRAGAHEFRYMRRSPEVHFGLQRAPARKPVFPRDRELCLGQLYTRVVPLAHERESIFRELLQVLVGCAFGEIQRHRHLPSIRARCPQLAGWKSGSLTIQRCARVGSTLDADRGPPVAATGDSSASSNGQRQDEPVWASSQLKSRGPATGAQDRAATAPFGG